MGSFKRLRSNLLLVLTAFIWGTGFVAQNMGMDHAGPFSFNATRNFVGVIALLPVIFLFSKLNKGKKQEYKRKDLMLGGIWCGVVLGFASALQQLGIYLGTDSGKAGFITALYMLIVPLLGLFLKKKVSFKAWIAVALGTVGMYFLCITEGFKIEMGDFVIFLCAILYAVHIMVIDHFSPKADGVKMSCMQFLISGIINVIIMLIFEDVNFMGLLYAWKAILYLGVMSSGVAYTLQIVAQKDTSPVAATLIMSLESVFAVLSGWLILKETMTPGQVFGCGFIFIGIILSQLPQKIK